MKPVTADWLRSGKTDLDTIHAIIDNPELTAVVAFHAQQCVEKCLKGWGAKAARNGNSTW